MRARAPNPSPAESRKLPKFEEKQWRWGYQSGQTNYAEICILVTKYISKLNKYKIQITSLYLITFQLPDNSANKHAQQPRFFSWFTSGSCTLAKYTKLCMVWQPNIHNMLCPWRTPPGGLPFPDKIAPYFQILATPLADSPGSCATQPACYSLGWNRQTDGETDGSRYRLTPPPPRRGHNRDAGAFVRCAVRVRRARTGTDTGCWPTTWRLGGVTRVQRRSSREVTGLWCRRCVPTPRNPSAQTERHANHRT